MIVERVSGVVGKTSISQGGKKGTVGTCCPSVSLRKTFQSPFSKNLNILKNLRKQQN